MNKVSECFSNARKEEEKGKKHKGLLYVGVNNKKAEEYVRKAKKNLEICDFYKERGFDYKIPEEWFYTLYYCGLAIITRVGVESRRQRCTALFIKDIKDKGLIEYSDEFIERITVHSEKEETSDVDEREKSRYGSSVKSEEIVDKYEMMMEKCKTAIAECEEIVFSRKEFKVPEELLK